jgi:hypothetical protein
LNGFNLFVFEMKKDYVFWDVGTEIGRSVGIVRLRTQATEFSSVSGTEISKYDLYELQRVNGIAFCLYVHLLIYFKI